MHNTRHTYATRLYRASQDIRVVQDALGHASPATTAIYAEPANETMLRAVASIEERYVA